MALRDSPSAVATMPPSPTSSDATASPYAATASGALLKYGPDAAHVAFSYSASAPHGRPAVFVGEGSRMSALLIATVAAGRQG